MKTSLKTLFATALTLISVTAFAAPTYHISGTSVVGVATFSSSGTCKVPGKKFVNAQYGTIYDSGDNYLGTGVIDATGENILAFQAGGMQSYIKYFVDQNVPQKIDMTMRISFMDTNYMAGYVMAQSGCSMQSWWTQPSSFIQIKQDMAKGTVNIAMKQSFIGDVQPTLDYCTSANNVVKCKSLQFKGNMSFKGKAILP